MQSYVIRRLLLVPFTLILVSIVVFILMRAVPGDAADVRCGAAGNFDEQCFEVAREELGLNESKVNQYFKWLGDIVLRGDFGFSLSQARHINEELGQRVWTTAQLGILAIAFTLCIGVPVGVISAVRAGRMLDYFLRVIAVMGLSVPGFWIAILVIIFPAVWWGVRVAPDYAGWEEPLIHLQVLAIPAFIIALAGGGTIARIVRSSMLEVLNSDHVRTARSKGLRERIVVSRHVFRPSMIALFTIVGLQFGLLLGGSVIMERIFNIPGMGEWVLSSIAQRDFMITQAVVVVFAAWFLLITLLIDIAYAWVDPRIRY
jgi:peptide/nickel transport system permease protein